MERFYNRFHLRFFMTEYSRLIDGGFSDKITLLESSAVDELRREQMKRIFQISEETVRNIVESAGYEHDWWKSENDLEYVWGQLDFNILVGDEAAFRGKLSRVLGRDVVPGAPLDCDLLKKELRMKYPDFSFDEVVKKSLIPPEA